jgi:ABC-type multidrug transport system fused ATPase/permease subunit
MTGWTIPDDAVELRQQPSREETFSFYGRLELLLRGPAAFIAEVAEYFWPQIRPAIGDPAAITIEVLVGGITATALAALPRRAVTLYRSPDGPIPDWNDGIGCTAPWGVDRLIVNPHTGSQIVVAGRHVRVLNPELERGVRDAIRVIKQLVTTTFEADGALTLHAAAFAVDGGAVALVGGKGSGKTTTVLAAVASGAR